ncbi:alpha/beta fold hydrolase [Bacterioplanoides sp. SCSIO 12839]|uniref:alpha/beta fold hydrolase n=1 Tax=Bacterioplanoides sp. SCSIO 12839 TaxID=2829569 RepID=UPI0021079AE3|nr:alpha/beta hydrolase [Bacterioplanoides sp. SCSIO 12839]UTW47908.1 alpha/beta hydrolase [Bacterioplanoides sp. SCSIO 12839]
MTVLHSQQTLMVDTPEGKKTMAYQLWQPLDHIPKRLVICVHGLTRNGRDFDFLARELAQQALVVCPDVLGRGDSERMFDAGLYGYPLYLQQMNQFLDFLSAEYSFQQCDWVGTSMGGLIGMMLAATSPSLNRLVLNDVGYFIPLAALQRIGAYVGQLKRFHSLAGVELYLRDIARSFGPLTDEQWHHLAAHGCEPIGYQLMLRYDPKIAAGFAQLEADVDLSSIWQQVTQPVLLLRGAESDLLSAETAQQMATREDVELVEFSRVGHAPMLMSDEQIAVVRNYLFP